MTKLTERAGIRFAAVSMLLPRLDRDGSLRSAIAEVIQAMSDLHHVSISEKTLYRWLKNYRATGWSFIHDVKGGRSCSALSKEFTDFLTREKNLDPGASIPELILRARQRSIISPSCKVDRSTVYRAAVRLNLPFYKNIPQKNTARAFAYKHRMQMVLCDGKHFRANGKKRVAFFYLDDATRHILAVKVGATETSRLFLRGLYKVCENYGLMEKLYMDHGSAFTAGDVAAVGSNLDIPIIFGRVGYPQGRGKIERFNRTALAACLRGLDKAGIDATYMGLELRINHYLKNFYSTNEHSDLGCSPAEAFQRDSRTLRFPSDRQAFDRHFCIRENRRVTSDNSINFHGQSFEMPLGYAGTTVELSYSLLDQKLTLETSSGDTTLHPLDKTAHARKPRAKSVSDSLSEPAPIVTAAEIAFNKDFQSIVSDDGGYVQSNSIKGIT